MFIAARFGSATAVAARARAESRDGVVWSTGRIARRLRRLRRHVAEDALPLARGGEPDRLGAQARRLVAVGPVEDRRRLNGQGRVRRGGDAVDVGVGARPDRRVAGRRHARKRWPHGLGTNAAAEHSPHVRRGGKRNPPYSRKRCSLNPSKLMRIARCGAVCATLADPQRKRAVTLCLITRSI